MINHRTAVARKENSKVSIGKGFVFADKKNEFVRGLWELFSAIA
jgi:hypothetical protein